MDANILLKDSDTLKLPLPLPYNGEEYSAEQINDFLDETLQQSKQPILIFGGNWCPDCRILDGTLQLPTIKKFMNKNYNIMHIDIGRYDKNMELISYFGIPKEKGVPRVLVFDKNKIIINKKSTKEWTTARDRRKQEVFDYFQSLAQ
ncbi:thioredoxin family protein [Gammaproteobacteria bacterium]|nr:thioredoxin family protein [Gammaproteobacteria bacterium]MDA8957643.1 thioredoxin family protein [Gammaproteobacteria bacterium]MDA9024460.1 thioredoxin family protein [Gammaproteobacteria bacterium]MDA9039090.1 thioredoxin family protein [Gammaproteobacteria bacterium]MDA9045089.1 thioredoxin family protein [Gammaproteobacteria bacterium]